MTRLYAQPKPRPALLTKRDQALKLATQDRIERSKCRARSGGRCEVLTFSSWTPLGSTMTGRSGDVLEIWRTAGQARVQRRCPRRSSQNHHLIGGTGRRNKGESILAAHRLDVCDKCHQEITNHVLVPIDGTHKEDAVTVRYERIK